jgi:beta-barrel assembly-enhancing protease
LLKLLLILGLLLLLGAKLLPRLGSALGVRARKPFRQVKWMWSWAAGSEADAIQAEGEYGRECAREFAAQFAGRPSRVATDVVETVGSNIAAAVKDPHREFQFRVVRANVPNAYALPGGFVFITEPLVDLCGHNRDEIAFFLGHEIAHITLGHARSQLTASTLLNAITARLSGAGMLLREMLRKGYSRDLELEADSEGARLAAVAGFDPRAATRALHRLSQGSTGDSGLAEYFASHPPLADRVKKLEQGDKS